MKSNIQKTTSKTSNKKKKNLKKPYLIQSEQKNKKSNLEINNFDIIVEISVLSNQQSNKELIYPIRAKTEHKEFDSLSLSSISKRGSDFYEENAFKKLNVKLEQGLNNNNFTKELNETNNSYNSLNLHTTSSFEEFQVNEQKLYQLEKISNILLKLKPFYIENRLVNFNLLEDVRILIYLYERWKNNKEKNVNIIMKEINIGKIVCKPYPLLMLRYNNLLKFLNAPQLEELYLYLEKNGFLGYLIIDSKEKIKIVEKLNENEIQYFEISNKISEEYKSKNSQSKLKNLQPNVDSENEYDKIYKLIINKLYTSDTYQPEIVFSKYFNLMEDIKILVYLYQKTKKFGEKNPEIILKDIEIKQIVHKTTQEMLNRYEEVLNVLKLTDLKLIYEYILENGFQGFLRMTPFGVMIKEKIEDLFPEFNITKNSSIYQNENPKNYSNVLKDISKSKENQENIASSNKATKNSIFITGNDIFAVNSTELNIFEKVEEPSISKKNTSSSIKRIIHDDYQKSEILNISHKNRILDSNCPCSSYFDVLVVLIQENLILKNDEKKNEIFDDLNKLQIEKNFENAIRKINIIKDPKIAELSDALNFLAIRFEKNLNEIYEILESVSGDTEDLLLVLENRLEKIRWTEIEDDILKSAVPENLEGLKLIAKYKGINRIEKRRFYKGYNND